MNDNTQLLHKYDDSNVLHNLLKFQTVVYFFKNHSFHYSRVNIGHGFLSNLVLRFSNYDPLLYILVLNNYFWKYKSKNIFEKVKINMQTSSVMVCIRMNSSFLLAHFMTIFM